MARGLRTSRRSCKRAAATVIAGLLLTPVALGLGGLGVVLRAEFAPLPPVPVPAENPITEQKRVLGKMLFWEEQLSSDHGTSCGTCHITEFAAADPRLARDPGLDGMFNTLDDVLGSAGIRRQTEAGEYVWDGDFGITPRVTPRNASTVINAAYAPEVFWDGRASGAFVDPLTGQTLIASGAALETQALEPPLDQIEMAHPGRDWDSVTQRLAHVRPLALATELPTDVADVLAENPDYSRLFEEAFGDPAITPARIAMALATYQRTLIADQTPWDDFIAGDTDALTEQQAQGWLRFQAVGCVRCHTPPLFTDQRFHSTGLRPAEEDRGRELVTGDETDVAAFKTASLRNAGLKRTFQHNGMFQSLEAAVDLYAIPPRFPEHVSPILDNVEPAPSDVTPISDFIRGGLTDPRVALAQFPFDRPRLASERRPSVIPIGGGTPHLLTDVAPSIIAETPAVLGSTAFRLGVHGVFEGEEVSLRVSRTPPVNGVIQPDELIGPVTAELRGGTRPVATIFWNIPDDARLDAAEYYFQFETATGARSQIARATLFCGTVACSSACPADTNADFVLDIGDIRAFVQQYLGGDLASDFNGDGVLDNRDLGGFVAAYLAGCSG